MRSFVNSVTEQLTGTLSLGAAVFASVLFASGMPSEFDVVSGMTAAAVPDNHICGLLHLRWLLCCGAQQISCTYDMFPWCRRPAQRIYA